MASSNLTGGFEQSSLQRKPFGIELGFSTDNVPETMETAIKSGATLVEEAKTKPWGQVVGYVRDLDGFLIEVCTPMND